MSALLCRFVSLRFAIAIMFVASVWVLGHVALQFGMAGQASEAAGAMNEHGTRGDAVCGPRCVWFILTRFGCDVDFIELVREIQWPDIEKGATLDSINRALYRRGVHTYPIRLARHARLRWPHPVVLHLDGEGHVAGHYVVWLGDASGRALVWDGVTGVRAVDERRLAEQRSGAALLTAPSQITDPSDAVESAKCSKGFVFVIVGLATAGAGIGMLLVHKLSAMRVRCRIRC